MNILHLSEYYLRGFSYQENRLPDFQAKLGNKVFFIASDRKYFDFQEGLIQKKFFEEEVKFILLKPLLEIRKNKKIFFLNIKLYKEILKTNPDVIHIHGEKNLMIFPAIKYKRKFPKTKIFIDSHADELNSPAFKSFIYRFLFKNSFFKLIYRNKIYKYVDKYLPINSASKTYLEFFLSGIVENSKIEIIPLGGDKQNISEIEMYETRKKYRDKLDIFEEEIIYFNSGKLYKSLKNVDELVLAFNEVNKTKSNIKLLLIGKKDAEIEKLLEESNNSNIICIDFVESKELKNFYLAGDVGVWTSASNSILEAMSLGRPLILKNTDTLKDLIRENGYLYTDVESLSKIMNEISLESRIFEKQSEASRREFSEKYDWEIIAKKCIEIYKGEK